MSTEIRTSLNGRSGYHTTTLPRSSGERWCRCRGKRLQASFRVFKRANFVTSKHSWTIYAAKLQAMTTMERLDPVTPNTSRRMSATKGRDNRLELSLRSALHRRGLRFRVQVGLLQSSRRSVDIVFPRWRVAIFVDGCFWHGCPTHGTWPKNNAQWWRAKIEANLERDRDTDRRLADLGWRVIRIWEHEELMGAVECVAAAVLHGQTSRGETDAGFRQRRTSGTRR